MPEDSWRKRTPTIAALLQRANSAFAENTEVSNGISISLLHDAIEHTLFLVLMKHHHPPAKRAEFKDLADEVAKLFHDQTSEVLPYRISLDTTNKLRVAYKHSGIIPARAALTESIEMGNAFVRTIFSRLFDIDVENYGPTDLIRTPAIRDQLDKARRASEAGEFDVAANACAEANWYFQSALTTLFPPGPAPQIRINTGHREIDHQAQSILGEVVKFTRQSDAAVLASSVLMSSGVSPMDMARFRQLTPHVAKFGSGHSQYTDMGRPQRTKEDIDFLIAHMTRITLWLEERFPTLQYSDRWTV